MKARWSLVYLFIYCLIWINPGGFAFPKPVHVGLRVALFIFILATNEFRMTIMKAYWIVLSIAILLSTAVFDFSVENLMLTVSVFTIPLGILAVFENVKDKELLINNLFIIFSVIVLLDIATVFLLPRGIYQSPNGDAVYFTGGKFTVCYILAFWIALFSLRFKDVNRLHFLMIMMFGAVYGHYVDSNTGMLAILSFGGIIFIPRFFKRKSFQIVWLVGWVLASYLIVILQVQSKVPFISNFITNVLHRSIHLTGRLNIYDKIPEIMEGHWAFGWGYTSKRIVEVTSLANTQNGFLQVVYWCGLVGFAFFALILFRIFRSLTKLNDKNMRATFLGLMTVFLLAATIEVPFSNTVFFLSVGLITLLTDRSGAVKFRWE